MKMERITYVPRGVCSRKIEVVVDDNGIITDAEFVGGCSGNTQGLCALVRGMSAEEAKKRLEGIKCGPRATSCPDQLARALGEYLDKKAQ